MGKRRRGKMYNFSNPKYWKLKELSLLEKAKIIWNSEVKRRTTCKKDK
jgi:hypothetical protein